MTCKTLGQATIPFLFDEVFMSATRFDIEVADNVTTHFAKHIKTITVSSRQLPVYDESKFIKLLQYEPSGWSHPCTDIEGQEKDAFVAYCKARAE